jgi:hypothetical protein
MWFVARRPQSDAEGHEPNFLTCFLLDVLGSQPVEVRCQHRLPLGLNLRRDLNRQRVPVEMHSRCACAIHLPTGTIGS